MSPIHRGVDGHAGNFHDCASDHLSIRWATTGGPTPVSRSDPVLRFVRSRQRFVREAIMVLEKPSSLLTEHDGLIHFDERPLDYRLRQSIPLQYLIIDHQHFEFCERCLPKVLV